MPRVSLWRLGGFGRVSVLHIWLGRPPSKRLGGFFYGERDETKTQGA